MYSGSRHPGKRWQSGSTMTGSSSGRVGRGQSSEHSIAMHYDNGTSSDEGCLPSFTCAGYCQARKGMNLSPKDVVRTGYDSLGAAYREHFADIHRATYPAWIREFSLHVPA